MFIIGDMFVRICFCLQFSYISIISGSGCSVTPDLFVALIDWLCCSNIIDYLIFLGQNKDGDGK